MIIISYKTKFNSLEISQNDVKRLLKHQWKPIVKVGYDISRFPHIDLYVTFDDQINDFLSYLIINAQSQCEYIVQTTND